MASCVQLGAGGNLVAHNAPTDEPFGLVYAELHKLARAAMRHERREHTLQPTALINEAYLRLMSNQPHSWENRAHFFGAAAPAMRQLLIGHDRNRQRANHAGAKVEQH